jgi:hypothetical protein
MLIHLFILSDTPREGLDFLVATLRCADCILGFGDPGGSSLREVPGTRPDPVVQVQYIVLMSWTHRPNELDPLQNCAVPVGVRPSLNDLIRHQQRLINLWSLRV